MILINPMKDTRHAATDELRWHINYIFATYLEKYIEIKGGNVMLSRKSEAATAMDLKALKINYAPAITITIDCYVDIDPKANGYDIICDSYNALVGTINYESYMQDRTPIRELGYKATGSLKYGKYTDIALYLGFVSNSEDASFLCTESNLDAWAKRLAEGAYGPPIKTIINTDPAGNFDPYFYRIDTWKEADNEPGSSASIEQTLYSGLPVRYLSIDSHVTGYYPVPEPPEGEEPIPEEELIPKHYSWSTPTTYDEPKKCLFIGSVRAPSGPATAYLRIGDTEYTEDITDSNFTIVMFEAEAQPGAHVYLGVVGTGRLDYSGIWVAPRGTLGTLDDPRSTYSIFPPGYRATTPTSDAYNNADAIHAALTNARTLIERAQDKTSGPATNTGSGIGGTSTNKPSSSGNKIDVVLSYASAVTSYAAALTGVMSILEEVSDGKLNIVDPTTINVDFEALENSISVLKPTDSIVSVLLSVNDIKTMADAVSQQLQTEEEVQAEATEIAETTKQKIEAKGVALGNS